MGTYVSLVMSGLLLVGAILLLGGGVQAGGTRPILHWTA